MENEKQVQPETEEQVIEPEDKKEKSIDEISAEIEARISEQFKKELAGLNRRNSELEKELKNKDLETMSAEEKAAALEKQAQEAEARIKAAEKKLAVDSTLYEAGLPADFFGSRIKGETEEEIKKDVANIKEYLDGFISKGIEEGIKAALKGKDPVKQGEEKKQFDPKDAVERARKISLGL